MTAREPTPEQVFARNAIDRRKLADIFDIAMRRAAAEAQTNWELRSAFRGHFRLDRWEWWVAADGKRVVEGTALTKAQSERRRYRAYLLALAERARRAGDGGEGGNRRRDIETSKLINRWRPWAN